MGQPATARKQRSALEVPLVGTQIVGRPTLLHGSGSALSRPVLTLLVRCAWPRTVADGLGTSGQIVVATNSRCDPAPVPVPTTSDADQMTSLPAYRRTVMILTLIGNAGQMKQRSDRASARCVSSPTG